MNGSEAEDTQQESDRNNGTENEQKVVALKRPQPKVADPDLQIRRGGRGAVKVRRNREFLTPLCACVILCALLQTEDISRFSSC